MISRSGILLSPHKYYLQKDTIELVKFSPEVSSQSPESGNCESESQRVRESENQRVRESENQRVRELENQSCTAVKLSAMKPKAR